MNNKRQASDKAEAGNAPVIDADEILDGILEWVNIESPSNSGERVNVMVDRIAADMQAVGATLERTPGVDDFGDILKARSPWGGDGAGILVLGHLDTVHPVGTLDDINPVRRDGDKVYGPGIYDMKSGVHIAYYAYRHLVRGAKETPLPITFLFIPEEEVGSPTSRATIEREALANKYVLVAEPARDGGKIVTGRKGAARFKIVATGKPAHSGLRHEDGRSAVKEIAHQILALEAMTDYETGITVSVGLIEGGTGVNVGPAQCTIEVDMRCPTPELGDSAVNAILGLKPVDPDVSLEITGGMNRPPYEKDAGIAKLYDHARELATEIGFDLQDMKTGGGSDGNFTAALGVPTLDGLGADGAGAHTDWEHIYYSSLVERTKLMLGLFETLT